MTHREIITKLVGEIKPVGDSAIDTVRLENLKNMCDLVEGLLYDIDDVALLGEKSNFASMRACGLYARKFLQNQVKALNEE